MTIQSEKLDQQNKHLFQKLETSDNLRKKLTMNNSGSQKNLNDKINFNNYRTLSSLVA